MRYLVAVIQYNLRDSDAPSAAPAPDEDPRRQMLMLPRGSVSQAQREVGLRALKAMRMVDSWSWDMDDAVAVVINPAKLRSACAGSAMCNTWAPGAANPEADTWGVNWLRLVWLTTQQKSFVAAVSEEELTLDLETCLCSLHLHGLLAYS